jgi:DNA-binding MarR family transcriptional regulator
MDPVEITLPALMRAARMTYAGAIRVAVEQIGCDDLPANGAYVIGAIAAGGVPLSAVIAGLGASKQSVGALVDTLVTRGYLDRRPDPDDRRRLTITLTHRGEASASAIRTAIAEVDARLAAAVGAEAVAVTRATLTALCADD